MKTMKIFRKLSLGFACRLVMLTVLLLVGGGKCRHVCLGKAVGEVCRRNADILLR